MRLLSLTPVLLFAIALSANAADFRDRTALSTQLDQGFQVALANAQESLASADAKLDTAEANLATAQDELADAQANGGDVTAAQAKVDAAQADVDAAQAKVDAAQAKVDAAQTQAGTGSSALVDQMSDDQVFALNRSLNNAAHNGLGPLAIDSALLQRIIDEGLDKHGIQTLTQALELRARFEKNADRFDAKGDSEKADQMAARGEALEGKFLARLDDSASDAAAREARDAAREAAREAKHAAKEAAHDAARDAHGHGAP